jgi:hypothetical protein
MEKLAELPPLALVTFGVTIAIVFAVRHLGLWQGSQPVANAAPVAAVIVDPTALNKATAAVGELTEALKLHARTMAENGEFVRRFGIEAERIREELRIHRELMRDRD